MARLKNDQLLDSAELLINNSLFSDTAVIVELLTDNYPISPNQANNFAQAWEQKDVSECPLYMIEFCQLCLKNNYNIDDIRKQYEKEQKPLTGGNLTIPENKRIEAKTLIFTSAQNNTEIHQNFFKSLKTYCKHNDAQLIIGKFSYNKNGFENSTTEDEGLYYAPELTEYFLEEQIDITDNLTWCGDLNILPTAKNPLSSLETYTGPKSSIIPHAKIALESIPTPKSEPVKMMYSTGCITQHNYIQKKAGQLAQKMHCYGALIVEIHETGEFFARQIQTDETGTFYDLDKKYCSNGQVYPARPLGVNWGDMHSEKSDFDVLECCVDLLGELEPENQFYHDLFDMTARNHHNRNSGHFLVQKYYEEKDSVSFDFMLASNILKKLQVNNIKGHVIESNHDLALEAWLNSNDYDFKRDPVNALTYLELQTHIYNEIALSNGKPNILEYALTDYINKSYNNLTFYNVDDSIVKAGVEFGYHGHLGANGSRGNPNQFTKLNRPMNTGHTHTASIKGTVYTAGITGSMEQEYNKGPSSWSHSHILTYPNGMRTILTMKLINGAYSYRV